MNIDEVMSDVPDAGTSSHGYVATKNSNSTPSGSGDDAPTWNTKKFRDECLNIRSRMLDSNFSFSVFLLAGLIRFFCLLDKQKSFRILCCRASRRFGSRCRMSLPRRFVS